MAMQQARYQQPRLSAPLWQNVFCKIFDIAGAKTRQSQYLGSQMIKASLLQIEGRVGLLAQSYDIEHNPRDMFTDQNLFYPYPYYFTPLPSGPMRKWRHRSKWGKQISGFHYVVTV